MVLTLHGGGDGTFADSETGESWDVNIQPGTFEDINGFRIYWGMPTQDVYASEFEGPNIIFGNGGDDELTGNAGNDYIFGGTGRDKL